MKRFMLSKQNCMCMGGCEKQPCLTCVCQA